MRSQEVPQAKEGGLGLGRLRQWRKKTPTPAWLIFPHAFSTFSWPNPRKERNLTTGKAEEVLQMLFVQQGWSKRKIMGRVMKVSKRKGTLLFMLWTPSVGELWAKVGPSEEPLVLSGQSIVCMGSLQYCRVFMTHQQCTHEFAKQQSIRKQIIKEHAVRHMVHVYVCVFVKICIDYICVTWH